MALALGASVITVSSAPVNGVITLHASEIIISASGITANGSPVLSSDQGTIAARQFTVALDKQGKASTATAIGGVRFNLLAPNGPYRTVNGTCSQAVLYPAEHRAVLLGGLAGTVQGPGVAPISLSGSERADIFGATPTTAAHLRLSGSRTTVRVQPGRAQ